MLEPSLPLWMMESWGAGSIERGAAFLPASISYLIGKHFTMYRIPTSLQIRDTHLTFLLTSLGTNVFGPLAHRIGRWLSGFIGLVIIGFCLLAVRFLK